MKVTLTRPVLNNTQKCGGILHQKLKVNFRKEANGFWRFKLKLFKIGQTSFSGKKTNNGKKRYFLKTLWNKFLAIFEKVERKYFLVVGSEFYEKIEHNILVAF
jgi:hypothetical protein